MWGRGQHRCSTGCGARLWLWAAAIAMPSMAEAHMRWAGPHDVGTEFIWLVLNKPLRVWQAHARAQAVLIEAHLGPLPPPPHLLTPPPPGSVKECLRGKTKFCEGKRVLSHF